MKTKIKSAKIKSSSNKTKTASKKKIEPVQNTELKLMANAKPIALTRSIDRSKLNQQTWVVFKVIEGGHDRKPMLFNAGLSRDKVRSSYSSITGTNRIYTRSRRLKNY